MRPCRRFACLFLSALLAACMPVAAASVFYKFSVAAETPTGGFTGFGNGPSINDKGKAAFVSLTAAGPSVHLWTPGTGLTNLAPGLLSPNRSFGDGVKINFNDEVVTWNRLLPLGLYEVRVFRAPTPDDSSIMVRGLAGTGPYDLLYQFPTINDTRILEDRRNGLPGNKDGICDTGEVCVSQIAFNAVKAVPARFLGTVVNNPTDAADVGVQHEFGLNTSQSRPAMTDDGRIVIRGVNASDPINLFNYSLGAPTTIVGSAQGFTALGRAPGITPDGNVIAFAGNRGEGDGIFLSIAQPTGPRRIVRILGENLSVTKPELGVDGNGIDMYFASIELDSRIGIIHTPNRDGVANKSVVVSFIGTPNAASRTNPGTGKPFLFSAQKGLWTIRIDLDAPLYKDICLVVAPGVTTNPFTKLGDDVVVTPSGSPPYVTAGTDGLCQTENTFASETLFSRSSPLPVVQIGDIIKSTAQHVVSDISVNDPIAQANYDSALLLRFARVGDHRVVFRAMVDGNTQQMIVVGEHLDSDQDGLLDHWETTGIDLEGTGAIDLNLAAMGADPFKRDLFMQLDWTADRPSPLNFDIRHRPVTGVMRKLAQFYASAPALPSGVAAGIQLHIDAGTGVDSGQQFFSRNMGTGPLVGGQTYPGNPVDLAYSGLPGSISFPGVTAVSFDSIKGALFWNHHRGAREFAFLHVVLADFHHGLGQGGGWDNAPPLNGTVGQASPFDLEDNGDPVVNASTATYGGIKITGGTGAGQLRTMTNSYTNGVTSRRVFQVDRAWATIPDTTSTYMLFHGSTGEGYSSLRYDGAFNNGRNLVVTLAATAVGPNNETGGAVTQFQSFDHEIGHLLSLMHGGVDHVLYKPNYVSVMNYAYQFCPAGTTGTDANGNPMSGAANCPVEGYSGAVDAISNNWRNIDSRFSTNFATLGHAFGSVAAVSSPFPPALEVDVQQLQRRYGPLLDQQAPVVTPTVPVGGATFALGATIGVTYNANDNAAVTRGEVIFDVNGNGVIDEATEVFIPAFTPPGSFAFTLPATTGASGSRKLSMIAYDAAGNPRVVNITINIGTVVPVIVPNVVGQSITAATTTLTTANLAAGAITTQQSGSVAAGTVISQIPVAGQSHPPGTLVSLVKSLGATGVNMPNLVGLSQAAATAAITGAGLALGTVTQTTVPQAPGVAAQTPLAGSIVAAGTLVHLLVAGAVPNVSVPNVVGLTQAAATSAINGVGLVVGAVTQTTSPSVPAGSVIAQNPASGTSVSNGSAVALVISLGPPCSAFTDVASGSAFCPNVEWLKNRGITLGCVTGSYCPADAVSRLAMAAFMNRLGTSLTSIVLEQEASPGTMLAGAGTVVCQTSDAVIAGFPRHAYVDAVFAATATAGTEFGADAVASLDGGASWINLTTNLSRATIRTNRWTNVRVLGDLDLLVGATVRFGMRITHGSLGSTAALADSRCQLRALLGNRNGASSPYDPQP